MSKTFKELLSESITAHKREFKVKIAGPVEKETEAKMKSCLERWTVDKFKKVTTTPVQHLPLDFPQVRNCEVNIFEVVLDYPVTQNELTEYLSTELSIPKSNLVVRNPLEPGEEYQKEETEREGALLDDPHYKEAGSPKFEDYYGDKYNSAFIKELNSILKLQRRDMGEKMPNSVAAKYNTDSPAYNKAPLEQAPDPRRK